jgi:hypothetical protein
MSHKHSRIRHLKQRWDDEDAVRDELERRAKQMFLEEQANQIFAPIGDYLTRLDKVLRAAGASVEIDAMWEHLGDQRLRRVSEGDVHRAHATTPSRSRHSRGEHFLPRQAVPVFT